MEEMLDSTPTDISTELFVLVIAGIADAYFPRELI